MQIHITSPEIGRVEWIKQRLTSQDKARAQPQRTGRNSGMTHRYNLVTRFLSKKQGEEENAIKPSSHKQGHTDRTALVRTTMKINPSYLSKKYSIYS